jgi:hypothetical protein
MGMASTGESITEADILSSVVGVQDADLPTDAARSLLELHFRDDAVGRMNELADRNGRGELTPAEQSELEKYLRVGTFLNLIQAKARLSLDQSRPASKSN